MTTGEHGEHSHEAMQGEPGPRGLTGKTGVGSPYLSRSRTLALFVFVVVAFVLLAVRSEINVVNIRQGVYENCITRAVAEDVRSDCERFR